MGSREGWLTLGQGLIGIGQNYQDINNLDTTARREELAEFAKQKRLGRTDMMTNVYAAQDRDLAERKFAADTAHNAATLAAQKEQSEATNKLAGSQQKLQETIALQGTWAQQQDVEGKKEDRQLQRDQFEWQKETTEERMKQDVRRMDMQEADMFQRHAIAQAELALKEEDTARAWSELELARRAQKFKETTVERQEKRADKALTHQIEQNKDDYNIKWLEYRLNKKRIEAGIESQDERDRIASEQLDIEKDLQDLREKQHTLEVNKADQVKIYQTAMLDISGRELALKEGAGKWKFTTRPIMERVLTDTGVSGQNQEYTMQKVGEEIIAINIQDPELQDVRVMQEDGSWKYGTPDGLQTDDMKAALAIGRAMREKGVSLEDAIARAKDTKPEYDWDALFIIMGAGASTGTADAVGADTTGTSLITPNESENTSLISDAANASKGKNSRNAGNRLLIERMGGTIDAQGNIILPESP